MLLLWLMVQDVMLSGVVTSQMPVTPSLAATTTPVVSISCVAMQTAGKLSSPLTDNVFVDLQSLGVPGAMSDVAAAARVAETAAATGESSIFKAHNVNSSSSRNSNSNS